MLKFSNFLLVLALETEYDTRIIRNKSQQPHGPYAQQYQGILKSIPDLEVEAVQSLSVEVTRNQQLAISQRGVLAYSVCTSITSRMFHSFLNFLVLLVATRPFLHSSFVLSSSKRPSTFLSVILHIISALLTFFHLLPTLSLSLFSIHPVQSKHTYTHIGIRTLRQRNSSDLR
jgi:hypothetical protein